MSTNWEKTRDALKKLEEELKCHICNDIFKDPWSVSNCDHSFCRTCITKAVNGNSKCPQCGSFAWLKDLQTNRELSSAVEFCRELTNVICTQKQEEIKIDDDEAKQEDAQKAAPAPVQPQDGNGTSSPGNDDTVNETENEQSESWPLSGIMKKKKSVKTYEKRHKQSDNAQQNTFVYQEKNDVNIIKGTSAEDVYDEKHIQDVENNCFKKDDPSVETSFSSNTSSTKVVEANEPKTRLRRRGNQANNDIVSPGSSKRKLSMEKDGTKSKVETKKNTSMTSQKTGKDKKRPSLTKVNIRGETPLHVAAIKGKYDKVKELLEYGADPNAKDFAGWTSLHEACNHGCLEIVQLLLDNGAFIDIPGCDHDTPLHDAIANNRLEVAEFLISKGASLDVRNKQGLLPMDYVKSNAVKEQLLLAASMAKENENANKSLLQSHVLKTDKSLPKCILHTGLDLKQKKIVEKCAKKLQGKVVEQFCDQVTHVVTTVDDKNLCSRTMKYILGVLTGKWIVSYDWIVKSLDKNEWISEDNFDVTGCPGSSNDTPAKARLNAVKQFPPLFDGCSFYFSGEFHSNPTKTELLDLIKLGGGVVLHREPKAETSHPLITPSSPAVMKMMSPKIVETQIVAYHAKPDTAQSHCTQFIIYDPEASPHQRKLSTPIMCTVPSAWILDCISNFEIVEVKES